LNTTLLPVPEGVGLNMISALADVATNERRMPPKARDEIFIAFAPYGEGPRVNYASEIAFLAN
jgi:hypothetical protein